MSLASTRAECFASMRAVLALASELVLTPVLLCHVPASLVTAYSVSPPLLPVAGPSAPLPHSLRYPLLYQPRGDPPSIEAGSKHTL